MFLLFAFQFKYVNTKAKEISKNRILIFIIIVFSSCYHIFPFIFLKNKEEALENAHLNPLVILEEIITFSSVVIFIIYVIRKRIPIIRKILTRTKIEMNNSNHSINHMQMEIMTLLMLLINVLINFLNPCLIEILTKRRLVILIPVLIMLLINVLSNFMNS